MTRFSWISVGVCVCLSVPHTQKASASRTTCVASGLGPCKLQALVFLLGGSWVGTSRVTIVITYIRGLITPPITTHEPPSRVDALAFNFGSKALDPKLKLKQPRRKEPEPKSDEGLNNPKASDP